MCIYWWFVPIDQAAMLPLPHSMTSFLLLYVKKNMKQSPSNYCEIDNDNDNLYS